MKKVMLSSIVLVSLIGLVGCKTQEAPVNSENTSSSSAQQSSAQVSSSTTTQESQAAQDTTNTKTLDFAVSLDDAIKSYQETYPDTDITGIDIDTSFGDYFYKIEGMNDTTQYEVKINVTSGELDKEREEKLDRDEQNGVERQQEKLELSDILTADEVAVIAEKEVPGTQAIEWSLNKDNGMMLWEVTVSKGNVTTDVTINATTGDVLEVDQD